jgi:UDP-glucose 4-epimerase
MKVLVTGSLGFIGSHVVSALADDDVEVFGVDILKPKIKWENKGIIQIQGDINESETWIKQVGNVDAVIHLAAQTSVPRGEKSPNLDVITNVLGTLSVLNAAKSLGAKEFRFASSSAVYGLPKTHLLSEESNIAPVSYYGISKYSAEILVQHYCSTNDIRYLIYRMSNVYGPGQKSDSEGGVVAIFSNNIVKGKPIFIFGDGNQTRDFIYVNDVADAFIFNLGNILRDYVLNLSTGSETKILELAKMIVSMSGFSDFPIEFKGRRAGDIDHSVLSNFKLKEFGVIPKTRLNEGLRETYNHYMNE